MLLDYTDKNRALGANYPDHLVAVMARHDKALEKSGAAHAVIFSGARKIAFLDDWTYPFKANPHFLAWLPLATMPMSYVIYTPGQRPTLIYFQPRDYWHTVPGEPDGYWAGEFDVKVIDDATAAAEHLPADRDKCIFLGEADDDAHTHGIERVNPPIAVNSLHLGRGSKTEYELACMRLASRRAVAGHLAAAEAFRAGEPEFMINQAYCEAADHTENELPYANIVAVNEHGAVLHYTDLDRKAPDQMRSFLIDAGAQVHGYAADITRTYANGDARFEALIGAMDAMQQTLVERIRAGQDYRELHLDAHRLLAALLVDAELASGDADTLIATGVTAAFFPHGLGHLLGVQVHDVGGFLKDESGETIDPPSGHPFLRLTRTLEADMVVTVEPGLYVIDMLLDNLHGTPAAQHVKWDTVEWLRPFGGIRIEDDVRVLDDGVENLTRAAFSDLE